MNKAPYKIIKHYRGKYQVLDANGMDLSRGYVSKHRASQIVIEYKLQDKCLSNKKLLVAAESVAGSRFKNNMAQWLWEVLIRFEVDELRLINKRPNRFKAVHDAWMERINKQLKNKVMPERKNLAKIDVITDCDSEMYHIGEIDGGFSEPELYNHIKKYGHQELCTHLAYLQFQVWDTIRNINAAKNGKESEKLTDGANVPYQN